MPLSFASKQVCVFVVIDILLFCYKILIITTIFYSFAISCGAGPPDVCECRPNYIGDNCETCDAGFYGQPEVIGTLQYRAFLFIFFNKSYGILNSNYIER